MICLDTDFIVDLLKQKPDAVIKYKSLEDDLATTEVNYFEVLFGIFKRRDLSQKELDAVEKLFNTLNILALDRNSSYTAAEIAGRLSKQGLIIEINDNLIAGICVANNCRIITKNVKHFSRIKGLKVETY